MLSWLEKNACMFCFSLTGFSVIQLSNTNSLKLSRDVRSKKGDKKMPTPRPEIIDYPNPTSLANASVLFFVGTGHTICGNIFVQELVEKYDVGMELSMTSCLLTSHCSMQALT